MKMKNITLVRNAIIQKINGNNDIKRLIYYLTRTPLESTGIDLDNVVQDQPDISEINFISEEKRILPFFSSNILTEDKVYVICRRDSGDLRDDCEGVNRIIIDVWTPRIHAELDYEQDRQSLIVQNICNEIDQTVIRSLGEIKVVHFQDNVDNTNKDFLILSIFVEVPTCNMKIG